MSNSVKGVLALSLVVVVAACGNRAPQEEFVVVQPEPISVEQSFTGKFK